jgi:tRNA threonylcarbamoyladenosine biosynthesis protein TsaB
MLILGVSTSDEECSIALWSGGSAMGVETFPGARSCLEELMPRIEKLLAENNAEMRDIGLFAVDTGPGGLAGIKIGLATVKTLAQVAGRPVAPVSSFRAICHDAAAAGAVAPVGLMLPLVNCTRIEFFSALYRRADGGVECASPERLENAEIFRERLIGIDAGEEVLVLGSAAERVKPAIEEILGPRAKFAVAPLGRPRAETVCEIAAGLAGVPYNEVQPNYLCLTQAERTFGIRA